MLSTKFKLGCISELPLAAIALCRMPKSMRWAYAWLVRAVAPLVLDSLELVIEIHQVIKFFSAVGG